MLDRLGEAVFGEHDAVAVLHESVSQQLVVGRDDATLRLDLPFASKGGISLKKIGLELVVRVDGQKRTLLLPAALGDFRPTGASFADGSLTVAFERSAPPVRAVPAAGGPDA
jgi:arsenite-transporting ATPase